MSTWVKNSRFNLTIEQYATQTLCSKDKYVLNSDLNLFHFQIQRFENSSWASLFTYSNFKIIKKYFLCLSISPPALLPSPLHFFPCPFHILLEIAFCFAFNVTCFCFEPNFLSYSFCCEIQKKKHQVCFCWF